MGKDITLKLGVRNTLRGDPASTGCILKEPSGTLGSTDGGPGSGHEEGESIGNVRRTLVLPMCTKGFLRICQAPPDVGWASH